MKTVISENEAIIHPMLSENEVETEVNFCIVVGNTCTLINGRVVDEDDLPKIIAGLEMALKII